MGGDFACSMKQPFHLEPWRVWRSPVCASPSSRCIVMFANGFLMLNRNTCVELCREIPVNEQEKTIRTTPGEGRDRCSREAP